MIVVQSFDGATGTEVLLEAHVVVAGAASDVNGLAPAGRVNFKVASRTAQIFPGIPRLRDATNNEIAHVADHPFRVVLLELTVDTCSAPASHVSLFLVPVACAALQLSIKIAHLEWFPDVNDIGRELDKGYMDGSKPTSGDAYVAGFSLAGLFDCKRAEAQV